jgi:putative peptidoglycan lipid II flippase
MLRSSLIVTVLTLGASILGFVVQLMLAQRFGVGVEVDAYLFSLSIPTFIAGLISAILSFNLTPRLVSAKSVLAFHHNLMGSVVIGVTTITLVLVVAMYGLMLLFINQILPSGSQLRKYDELHALVVLTSIVGGGQIVQGCVSAMLNSERKFVHGALIALLPYVGMLGLLVVLEESAGIKTVVIGLLLGTIAAVFIGISLMRKSIFPISWKSVSLVELSNLAKTSFYTAFAMSCFSAYSIVDAYWGPRAGDGALATLGYAQRLVIAVGNLAVAGPSAVLVPHFAEYLQNKNYRGFLDLMRRAFILVAAIAIVVALVLGALSAEIASLLFGYGEFGQDNVLQVANTMTNMTPGMVAMLLSVIGLRVLFCFESAHKQEAILGLAWTIGYFIASSFAHKFGPPGIALAYSSVWFITICAISVLIYKRTRNFNA